MTNRKGIFVLLLGLLIPALCSAAPVTLSGYLNDAGNVNLIGSGVWTGAPAAPPAPSFADDWEIANNVALYTFTVASAGQVNFLSKGFTAGGADPYFTLFSGTGGTAAFAGSNYDQAFSTGGDFNLNFALAAGDYSLALGAFANMSFAENLGAGSLADGFVGLGGPDFLGNYYYELEISQGEQPPPEIPEPSYLPALGLLGAWFVRNRLKRTR